MTYDEALEGLRAAGVQLYSIGFADGYESARKQVEAKKRADILFQPGERHEDWCDDGTCPCKRKGSK